MSNLIQKGKGAFFTAVVGYNAERIMADRSKSELKFKYKNCTYICGKDNAVKGVMLILEDGKHLIEWLAQGEIPSDEFFKTAGENKFELIIVE